MRCVRPCRLCQARRLIDRLGRVACTALERGRRARERRREGERAGDVSHDTTCHSSLTLCSRNIVIHKQATKTKGIRVRAGEDGEWDPPTLTRFGSPLPHHHPPPTRQLSIQHIVSEQMKHERENFDKSLVGEEPKKTSAERAMGWPKVSSRNEAPDPAAKLPTPREQCSTARAPHLVRFCDFIP